MTWRHQLRTDGYIAGTKTPRVRDWFTNDAGVEIEAVETIELWRFTYRCNDIEFKFSANAKNISPPAGFSQAQHQELRRRLGPDCHVYIRPKSLSRFLNEEEKARTAKHIGEVLAIIHENVVTATDMVQVRTIEFRGGLLDKFSS